jgi:hypothetical protein
MSHHQMTAVRRCWALVLAGVLCTSATATDVRLRLIGAHAVPSGALHGGVEFGGISGMDRFADGSYVAISDDRGGERGAPRFYRLALDYDAQTFHGVRILDQIDLQRPDGQRFPADHRTVDPEAIRVAPHGHLYWSSEGIWSPIPSRRQQPFVREMRPDGSHVREFDLPSVYQLVDNASTGGRNNKLLEALALSPDGTTLYVANEEALIQDGPVATQDHGSWLRVTALDTGSGRLAGQYAYALPPIPAMGLSRIPASSDNGLTALLGWSYNTFIAVERAYVPGAGNFIRLVRTTIRPGVTTDVQNVERLADASPVPMSREVLLELPPVFQGVRMDNIEGISWGRTLDNGNRTLVLVADNNFSARQRSLFMVFELQHSADRSADPGR